MQNKYVCNPYLPMQVCIPDGEPHVFGDRVYVYGSHDKEGGDAFCLLDYEVWSAPVTDRLLPSFFRPAPGSYPETAGPEGISSGS